MIGNYWSPRRSGRAVLRLPLLALSVSIHSVGINQASGSEGDRDQVPQVQSLRVQILSTMLAERGIGEWGFAAIVEVDGRRILFDTGRNPDIVLKNARELDVDLSTVTDVVLSHNHGDHTGGLLTLRREYSKVNKDALSKVHVASGIFARRRRLGSSGEGFSPMLEVQREFEATGGVFIEYEGPAEIMPGVWLTGPVTRVHPERNWGGGTEVFMPEGWVEDNIPESQSLVVITSKGLVVLSGCGHAGIINTIEHARREIVDAPAYAVIGGFHLLMATDQHLDWTAEKLRQMGTQHFLGAHCTGLESVYRIRRKAGLLRESCVVGAVGAWFDLESGIEPLNLAR